MEFGKIMNVTIVYLSEQDDDGCGRPELRTVQEIPLYKPEEPGSVSGSCNRSSSYGEEDDTPHQEGQLLNERASRSPARHQSLISADSRSS